MSRTTEVPVIPVHVLMAAYGEGRFPMAHADGELYWHDPDPRAVFDLDALRPNTRLARIMRNPGLLITRDQAFTAVSHACADLAETWIDARIRATYAQLHRAGHDIPDIARRNEGFGAGAGDHFYQKLHLFTRLEASD